MAKKKVSKKSNSKKCKLNFQNMNYWAIATVVLAVLLGASLLTGGTTAAVVSPETAGQKVLDFAKSQGADAEFVSASDTGSLYEVVISIEGQEVPVYVTKDGKTLVPQPISLETTSTPTETQTPSQTTSIPKSSKPVVEAFVMSHCPYGTQIEKGLIPVMELLGDKIDAEIKFVYYAMHPTYGEVQEQLNQYCIQRDQNDKFNDYLMCFLEAGDGAGCINSIGIDTGALTACVETTDAEFNVIANLEDQSTWLSGRYPKFNIYLEDNEKYSIGGSPTLVINGQTVQVGRDSASLLSAICSAFEEAPEECNTEFDSATPSAGFGFDTTTSANAATAGCGA